MQKWNVSSTTKSEKPEYDLKKNRLKIHKFTREPIGQRCDEIDRSDVLR